MKDHKKNPDHTDVQFPHYLTTREGVIVHKWDDVKVQHCKISFTARTIEQKLFLSTLVLTKMSRQMLEP